MKIFFMVLSLLVLLTAFQNCGPGPFDSVNSASDSSSQGIDSIPGNNDTSPSTSGENQNDLDNNVEGLPEVNGQLKIEKYMIEEVGPTSIAIRWFVNDFATGKVEIDKIKNSGNFSREETSFKYKEHIQIIGDLTPETTYYLKIHSTDKSGNVAVSDVFVAKTKKMAEAPTPAMPEPDPAPTPPSTPVAGWPKNANENLPLAGIFYGNPIAGVGVQNATIAYESSRRFRAEKSGKVKSMTYNNRMLTMHNITSRCKSFGKGSVWCNCVDNGLDEYTCGYTLGSSYSVGNGGTIVIELRPDDGKGNPSDKVLGKTEKFYPGKNPSVVYADIKFVSQPTIQAGAIYHLVFTNLNPPTKCRLSGVKPSEAKNCPRNQGAIGLNGARIANDPTTTGRRGPYRGNASATMYKQNNQWKIHGQGSSFYELRYVDGVAIGDSYSQFFANSDGRKVAQGANQIRQQFTVRDANRSVNGLWVNYGHFKNSGKDALAVKLKNSKGTIIAQGKIIPGDYCLKLTQSSANFLEQACKDWGYTSFGKNINLALGQTYTVEFVSSATTSYVLSAYYPLTGFTKIGNLRSRNYWSGARAQYSTNNGATWKNYEITNGHEADLAILFTIEGMPKQLN